MKNDSICIWACQLSVVVRFALPNAAVHWSVQLSFAKPPLEGNKEGNSALQMKTMGTN